MAKKLPLITDFNNIPEEALVPEDEQPYEIPAHWKWVRLGSIANFIGGGTPDKAVPDFWNGEIPWASVKDLRASSITTTQDTISQLGLDNSSVQLCEPGNLILATRITPGKSTIANRAMAINQDLKIVKTQLLLPEFLQLYLDSQSSWFEANSSGSTVMGIRISALDKLATPLPPLDEQQRIVDYVDQASTKVDDVIQRLEQYIEEAPARRNKLIQAGVSGAMTTDWRTKQGLGQVSWLQTSIGELGPVVTGNTPPTKNAENYGDYMPFIKPADLNQGRHTISADSHLSEVGAKVARVTPADSVAMCCIGATITKAGLIEVEAATNQQINVLTPSADHDPVFLFYLFESPAFKNEVIATSSSTTLPIINKGRFSKLEVVVPSLREQQKIASILDDTLTRLEQTIGLIQVTVDKLHSLRSDVASAALAGNMTAPSLVKDLT